MFLSKSIEDEMTREQFWNLIAKTEVPDDLRAFDVNATRAKLAQLLRDTDEKSIKRFSHHYSKMMMKSSSYPLGDVVELMTGGCGDDSFFDFCDMLIVRGKNTFEQLLSKPDSIVDFVPKETNSIFYLEAHFGNVPRDVLKESGCDWAEMPKNYYKEMRSPKGNAVDLEDETATARAYPRVMTWLSNRS